VAEVSSAKAKAGRPLVPRWTDKRANSDDTEKKFVNGNLRGGSYFAKSSRQEQVKSQTTEARKRKQSKQRVAEKRRQA